MKQARILVATLSSLASLLPAKAENFFLFHPPTETVAGPYSFESGARLGTKYESPKIRIVTNNLFNIAEHSGRTLGPFTYADQSVVKVGDVELVISTNLELMLQKRADQKLWQTNPEMNPKVLAVIRGDEVDGYKFIRADPEAVVVREPKGLARIKLAVLPEDVQKKFQFDPAKAAAFASEQAATTAAWQQQRAAADAAKLAEQEKFWNSAKPPEVVQPVFPEPYFPTKGLGVSSGSGSGNNNNNNNNNSSRSSRNNPGSRTITIGGRAGQ